MWAPWSGRTLIAGMAGLLGTCGPQYVATDEFSRPTPGSYVLVAVGPDDADAIMMNITALLAREPGFRDLALSNGLESVKLYSFKFRETCAAQPALVAAVKAEIARTTAEPARCVDQR